MFICLASWLFNSPNPLRVLYPIKPIFDRETLIGCVIIGDGEDATGKLLGGD